MVIHARELERTSNTGRLALEALPNSEMRVRGETKEALDLSDALDPAYHPLIFYPANDAVELNADLVANISKPILLIVPDGSWRQASKVHTRQKELAGISRVMIQQPNLETRHLRTESTAHGMATLQAIAKALGVIEGPEIEACLMTLYRAKLKNTLKSRTFRAP